MSSESVEEKFVSLEKSVITPTPTGCRGGIRADQTVGCNKDECPATHSVTVSCHRMMFPPEKSLRMNHMRSPDSASAECWSLENVG